VEQPVRGGGVGGHADGQAWDKWDDDLSLFMDWHDNELWGDTAGSVEPVVYANSWFPTVAVPVAMANKLWKHGRSRRGLDHCRWHRGLRLALRLHRVDAQENQVKCPRCGGHALATVGARQGGQPCQSGWPVRVPRLRLDRGRGRRGTTNISRRCGGRRR
jgi:hypothetical protein